MCLVYFLLLDFSYIVTAGRSKKLIKFYSNKKNLNPTYNSPKSAYICLVYIYIYLKSASKILKLVSKILKSISKSLVDVPNDTKIGI